MFENTRRTAPYLVNIQYVCALFTWSCQKLHCCCCWSWTPSLSWNEGDEAHFCTRGSSLSLAGFLHQNHYLATLKKTERQREVSV